MTVSVLRLAALGVATLALAAVAGANAFDGVAWSVSPQAVLKVRPNSARALTRDAEFSLAAALSDRSKYPVAQRKAIKAMAVWPTNPRALQILGLAAENRRDEASAQRYMTLSSQLSRRNGLVQIWLVNQAARAGHSAEALTHFDITMRASPGFSTQIFPILGNALQSREIRDSFKPYIRSNPSWLAAFVGYTADQSPNPAYLATAIVEAGGLPADKSFKGSTALLLDKLSLNGKFVELGKLYRTVRRDGDISAMTSLSVDRRGTDPDFSPITWKLAVSDDVQVSPVAAERAGHFGLRIEAFDTAAAEVAHKFLFLKPGSYRIAHRAVAMGDGRGSLKLILACPKTSVPLATIDLRGGRASARIVVPASCAVQLAALAVSDATGDNSVDLALTQLEIVPG